MKRLVIIQFGSRAMRIAVDKLCIWNRLAVCRRDGWKVKCDTCNAGGESGLVLLLFCRHKERLVARGAPH